MFGEDSKTLSLNTRMEKLSFFLLLPPSLYPHEIISTARLFILLFCVFIRLITVPHGHAWSSRAGTVLPHLHIPRDQPDTWLALDQP